MRWVALLLCGGCGELAIDIDAGVPDANADACPFCFGDAGFEETSPPPPPPPRPIDAGVLDGSAVWCGASSCGAPAQYCCIQGSQLADGGLDLMFACQSASQPIACGASIYCDDSTDCAPGAECCWDRYAYSRSTCVPSGTCHCPPFPNCNLRVMCEPDASTCNCKADPNVPEYGTCW
jgi:hypothetical protein